MAESKSALVLRDSRAILTVPVTFTAWLIKHLVPESERHTPMLSALNAAHDLSFAVSDRSLQLKSQHVRALAATFREQQAGVRAHYEGLANGTIPRGTQLIVPHVDLVVIEALRVPIERLEEIVLEKVAAGGKISQRVITLAGCIESINDTIRGRNALAEAYNRGEVAENEKVARLFGLPLRDGSVDVMFSELTLGLLKQVDNCIYFSSRLCQELEERGKRVRERCPKRFRQGAPRMSSCNFKQPAADGLMPNAAEFAEWERAFILRVPTTSGRYVGRLRFCVWKQLRPVWRRLRMVQAKARKDKQVEPRA